MNQEDEEFNRIERESKLRMDLIRDVKNRNKAMDREYNSLVFRPWMVFNVGCIECGVSSNVVGLYATEEEAKQIAKTCEDHLHWREGGQNAFEVFDLRAPQAQEYTDVIANVKDKP